MSALKELAGALIGKPAWVSSVTTEVTDAVHSGLPELGDDDEMRRATYANTESNVRLFLEIIRAGADPATAEPPPTSVEYAREFVRQGVTIDALLRAYHIGQASFLGRWSAAVRESVDDEAARTALVEECAAMSFDFINAITRELVWLYAAERDRWVRSAAAVRAEVVRALLAGESVDIERVGGQLGYRLDRDHLAFVVWSSESTLARDEGDLAGLEGAAVGMSAKVSESSPLLVPFGSATLAGWIGGVGTNDAATMGGVRLPADSPKGARMAIGSPGSGPKGFARSHRQALQARRVAELAGSRPGSVTAYADVSLGALASSDVDHAREFVATELSSLAADDDDALRLAGTLRVYLEERSSPTRTAERLGVHPNTIANRVRTVEEVLGHPVESRVSELLVALRLAPLVRDP